MTISSDKQTNGIKDLVIEVGELTMLFWQLPLLSVVFSNPHQTVVTNKERQNDNNNNNNSSSNNNNPHQNVVTNNKERQRRAVFDMIPTLKQDKRCRTKTTAGKAAAAASSEERTKITAAAPSEERMKFESDGKICPGDKIGRRRSILKRTKAAVGRRKLALGNNNEMKKLLRKIFLETTVPKKEKKYALRAHEKITKDNQKKSKSKMSVKDLLMRGMPSVVQILLRIG